MGVLRRLGDMARAGLNEMSQRTFGRSAMPLSELSDSELEEELLRRRRVRAAHGGKPARRERRPAPREEGDSPQRRQLLQCYANLELEPGASLEDVRRSYRELMSRYHPDKHLGDPERHKAATELAQSLTKAYQALSDHLRKPAR